MNDPSGALDLSWTKVEYYLGEGMAASYRLSGPVQKSDERYVSYEIGDGGRDISLCVELRHDEQPPRSPLPAVLIDQVAHRGLRMARVRTVEADLIRDFHELLMAIASRILADGRSPADAFVETVRGWSGLLGQPRTMGLAKRLGLHGELAVLAVVAQNQGWDVALESWTGPANEEHDFALAGFDLEVKTTASEERRHTVHGLDQLEASSGRPLWFASVQLTRGGPDGRSLAESVVAVGDSAVSHSAAAGMRFSRAVAATGWTADAADDERWTLRRAPLVLVADDLPRLRPVHVPSHVLIHIRSVQYDIVVTGRNASPHPPLDLADLQLP